MEIFLQLILALILGGLLGLEREYKKKEAGLRTYALVALGSTIFTLIGFNFFDKGDALRTVQAVALGIGFIGAGLIIYRQGHVEGLTTAAGLWVAAAIGVAVAVKFYLPAVFVTFLAVSVLAGLRLIEEKFLESKPED